MYVYIGAYIFICTVCTCVPCVHKYTLTHKHIQIYPNAFMCTKYGSIHTLMCTCTDTHKHFSDIYCLVGTVM